MTDTWGYQNVKSLVTDLTADELRQLYVMVWSESLTESSLTGRCHPLSAAMSTVIFSSAHIVR